MKIDTTREDFYTGTEDDRTKKRLEELIGMGVEVVGVAEFGVPLVWSGLYIEKVWYLDSVQWREYTEWAKQKVRDTKAIGGTL